MRFEVSGFPGLPELHRVGHICVALNDGALFLLWGGANNRLASSVSSSTYLWMYNTLTNYCTRQYCTGECPPDSSGATSSLIGHQLYVFGGLSFSENYCMNGLYCLDLRTFVWRNLNLNASAQPTSPINSAKCVSWSYNGRLYVFGGYGCAQVEHFIQLLDNQPDFNIVTDSRWPATGWNNQLVEYDPRSNNWRWPKYSGKVPSARAGHTGALMHSKYYLFGGRNDHERFNDLYVFDMQTFNCSRLAVFSSDEMSVGLVRPLSEFSYFNPDIVSNDRQQRPPLQQLLSHAIQRAGIIPSQHLRDNNTGSTSSNSHHNQAVNVSSSVPPPTPLSQSNRNNLQSASYSCQSSFHRANGFALKPDVPPSRSLSSFTPINSEEILLCGGVTSQLGNNCDFWLFNIRTNHWTRLDINIKSPKFWHTASCTRSNEVVIIGGSCTSNPRVPCSEIWLVSLEPKSLKRLALDSVSKFVSFEKITKIVGLPYDIVDLIQCRKQAMSLSVANLKGFVR